MTYLLYALGAYLLYLVIRYILVYIQVWGWTLKVIRFEPVAQMPDELNSLFQKPIEALCELGFEPTTALAVHNIMGQKSWARLLHHQETKTFAMVELRNFPDPVNLFTTSFYTFLDDGTLLMTVNGLKHLIIDTLPNTTLQDAYTAESTEQWRFHQETLNTLDSHTVPTMPVHHFINRLEQHYAAYIEHLLATNQVMWDENLERLYLKPLAIARFAWKMLRGNGKARSLQQQLLKQPDASSSDVPTWLEVEAFHHLNNQRQRQATIQTKIWVIVISLILFILSFLQFFEIETLLILVGVLLLHEAGHFVAMKFFGYKNMSLFFLPFFGAAVTGEKQHVSLTESMLVLFAGPLPGLLLGIALYFLMTDVPPRSTMQVLINLLLVLNYLNLLPLFPLDGGRIVNDLLFSHNVYAGALFQLFAVLVFLAAGFWFNSFLLLFLGLIIGIGVWTTFQRARYSAKIHRHLAQQPADKAASLEPIFEAIKRAGLSALPFQAKYHLIKNIRQRTAGGGPVMRLAYLAVYLFFLIGSPLIMFWPVIIDHLPFYLN